MTNIIKSLIISLLIITSLSCEKDNNAKQAYLEGINKALVGNFSGARKSFMKSLNSDINANYCLLALGVLNKLDEQIIEDHTSYFFFSALDKVAKGDMDASSVEIDKAISSKLNFSEALIIRAIINQQKGGDAFALKDYSSAIQPDPDKYNFVYNNRGIIHAYLGNFKEAINDFDMAIKINPKHLYAYFNRANTSSIINNKQDAIDYYTKALAIDPKFHEALFFRANAYLELGDFENAIKDYTNAILLKPKFAMAYINRAIAYSKSSNLYEDALRDYTKAINIYPWYGIAYYNRAVTYSYVGNFEKAIDDYTAAIEQDPWFTKMEIIWNGKNENKQIFNKYEYEKDKTIELNPRYSEVTSNRGVVYIYKGITDKIVSDYNKALKLYPWYAMAYYNRGISFALSGKFEQAISDYNKALEINPSDPEIIGNRAMAYYYDGKVDKAFEDVRIAKELGYIPDPEFLDLLDNKASGKN
jgi:tetratricopeptide (TPR) repeat protein